MLGVRMFRVFVSSTFTDFKAERDILQKKVFDRLSAYCTERRYGFQAVDLRWGITSEAAAGQRTMRICLAELERCRAVSPRPNFVVMLGDRYGWRPLPEVLNAEEFERVIAVLGKDAKAAVGHAYYRDDNAVPPAYMLAPADGLAAYDAPVLREALEIAARAAGLDAAALVKYTASATEQEIIEGALTVPDVAEHVFCCFRTLSGLPASVPAFNPAGGVTPSQSNPIFFSDYLADGSVDEDAKSHLRVLKSRLRDKLDSNVFEYDAMWLGNGLSTDHVDRMCADMYQSLRSVIDAEIDKLAQLDYLEREREAHRLFAEQRAESFVGRKRYLDLIAEYLASGSLHPLAIYSEGGMGKSALMAKALAEARAAHPDAVIISRFIGVTSASSDLRALLADLCTEIGMAYGSTESVPSALQELQKEFQHRLKLATVNRPLAVFVDALDQLPPASAALSWLPVTLPRNVQLVMTTRPNRSSGDEGREQRAASILSSLRARLPEECVVVLDRMSTEEGGAALDGWMAASKPRRTLTSLQRTEVIGRFETNGSPLYLRFACEEAKLWPSERVTVRLGDTTRAVIDALYERLEREHGRELVGHALAFLAVSRNRLGLSEGELIAALAADEETWAEFATASKWHMAEHRLPTIVWSRLYFDLAPYLSPRTSEEASLLTFFHRELGDAAQVRYAAGLETHLHGVLADVFAVAARGAAPEERKWKGTDHALAELPFHLTGGKRWDDVFGLLTDFTFLEEKARRVAKMTSRDADGRDTTVYNGVLALIDDYDHALATFPGVE